VVSPVSECIQAVGLKLRVFTLQCVFSFKPQTLSYSVSVSEHQEPRAASQNMQFVTFSVHVFIFNVYSYIYCLVLINAKNDDL